MTYGAKFNGKPCVACGETLRRVSNKQCVACQDIRAAAWRVSNPEKAAESGKKWRSKNPHQSRDWYRANPARTLTCAAKGRAKQTGLEFSITPADVVIPPICPVLGIPIVCGGPRISANSPSIDRWDNKKGYTKENIRVISMRANGLKRDGTAEELLKVA